MFYGSPCTLKNKIKTFLDPYKYGQSRIHEDLRVFYILFDSLWWAYIMFIVNRHDDNLIRRQIKEIQNEIPIYKTTRFSTSIFK